jgi:hypothetical protein
VTKATTFIRRRPQRARLPLPVITAHVDMFDFGCLSCPVQVRGLPDETAAKTWAENHRCNTDLATSDRRPWP